MFFRKRGVQPPEDLRVDDRILCVFAVFEDTVFSLLKELSLSGRIDHGMRGTGIDHTVPLRHVFKDRHLRDRSPEAVSEQDHRDTRM